MQTGPADAPRIDLRKIRFFVAVARKGSFVAASRELRVSQPAVSYQIKELETELRVQLLVRVARGVSLTPAGETFLAHAEEVLERLRAAADSVKPFRQELCGEVSVGMTPTPARFLASPLLESCDPLRGLRIRFEQGLTDELHQKVLSGALDVALCYDPRPQPGVRLVPLCYDDLYLIGLPERIGHFGDSVDLEELAGTALVLDGSNHAMRAMIERAALQQGVRLRVDVEADTVNLKRGLIGTRGLSTIGHYGLFFDEISAGRLAATRIVAPGLRRTLSLVMRQSLPEATQSFLTATFASLVRAKLEEGAPRWRSISARENWGEPSRRGGVSPPVNASARA